ncbi:MAG: DNA-binding response OmpR family regulator [Kiritimatiellia bacterium]|jgi:DNA-binding response OmpR family regulator
MSELLEGVRILLIDDDMDYSETLHAGLHAAGATITCAGTIAEGVSLSGEHERDLILLDLCGAFDARSGLEAFNGLDTTPPIILLTDNDTDSEDTVGGLEQGADDYLMKPFTIPELCVCISDVLSGYDRTQDSVLFSGDLIIDRSRGVVFCKEETLTMPADALPLLSWLAQNESKQFTESELLDALYGGQLRVMLDQISTRLAQAGSVCRISRGPQGVGLVNEEG